MKNKIKYKTVNVYKESDKKERRRLVTEAVQRCIDRKTAA